MNNRHFNPCQGTKNYPCWTLQFSGFFKPPGLFILRPPGTNFFLEEPNPNWQRWFNVHITLFRNGRYILT